MNHDSTNVTFAPQGGGQGIREAGGRVVWVEHDTPTSLPHFSNPIDIRRSSRRILFVNNELSDCGEDI